jgi:hypothetical protein
MKRLLAVSAIAVLSLAFARDASAAPPGVERPDTLPRHNWAFDFGLGIGHNDFGRGNGSFTGPGLNLEGAVGIIDRLELGFRGGIRMNDEARAVQADNFGRLFDRQTFGVDGSTFSNPELRIRGNLVRERVFELSLEGRIVLPFERQTYFAAEFGVPLRFHFGIVRLDTGVWLPLLVFQNNPPVIVSIPVDVWFQVTEKLWLGPMTGITFYHQSVTDPGPPPVTRNFDEQNVSLGFGLGYQIASMVDFKTMFLFPAINHDPGANYWGIGAGIQVRIE